MTLAGKVAIVTGSSRGIGKDIALAFAAAGADIVVAARSDSQPDPRLPGTIHETAQEVEAFGRRALAIKTDVTDEEQIAAMVQSTLDTFGRIDILVNNAAVLVPRGILELPTRHLDLHYRVNIKGPILCIRAVLPTMLQQGQGWIINISSNAAISQGLVPTPMSDRYGPSCTQLPRQPWSGSPKVWRWSTRRKALVLMSSRLSVGCGHRATCLA